VEKKKLKHDQKLNNVHVKAKKHEQEADKLKNLKKGKKN